MISFSLLGQYGRLGNQLFEMAATIGLAVAHNDRFAFPRWAHEGQFPIGGCFSDFLVYSSIFEEQQYHYAPIPYYPSLDLRGYFQSERYFAHCAPLVRSLFKQPVPTIDACFIHVRRGDFLKLAEYHPVQTPEYFQQAMSILAFDRYIVFSDDLEWCRANFVGQRFEFSEGRSEVEDLQLMASCRGGILSNSSFSWWGAWLGNMQDVVCPKEWVGPAYASLDTRDVTPQHWIKI
jgi:Glycosyl transferase family 11